MQFETSFCFAFGLFVEEPLRRFLSGAHQHSGTPQPVANAWRLSGPLSGNACFSMSFLSLNRSEDTCPGRPRASAAQLSCLRKIKHFTTASSVSPFQQPHCRRSHHTDRTVPRGSARRTPAGRSPNCSLAKPDVADAQELAHTL